MAYAKLGSATLGTTQLGWSVELTGTYSTLGLSPVAGTLAIGQEPQGNYAVLTKNEYAATLYIGQEPISVTGTLALTGAAAALSVGNDLPQGGQDTLSLVGAAGQRAIGQEPVAAGVQALTQTGLSGSAHAGLELTGFYRSYGTTTYSGTRVIGQEPISVTGVLALFGPTASVTHGNDLPEGAATTLQFGYLVGDVLPKMFPMEPVAVVSEAVVFTETAPSAQSITWSTVSDGLSVGLS